MPVAAKAAPAATLTAVATLLAGCAGAMGPATVTAPSTQPVISQEAARKGVLANRSAWKDPDSIKDAKIGPPYACTNDDYKANPSGIGVTISKAPASCVCLELNARNSYGGYTGMQRAIAVFPESGGFTTLDGGTKGFQEHCQNLQPFPELNGPQRTAR